MLVGSDDVRDEKEGNHAFRKESRAVIRLNQAGWLASLGQGLGLSHGPVPGINGKIALHFPFNGTNKEAFSSKPSLHTHTCVHIHRCIHIQDAQCSWLPK